MRRLENSLFSPFFAPFQLAGHGFPQKIGLTFGLLQRGLDALKGALGEAAYGLLEIDLFSAHGWNIDDITNCYKPHFSCYHLFTILELLISSKHQHRETGMTYRAELEGFHRHFDTCEALKAWAEDLNRQYSLTGKTLKVWKAVWVAKDGSGAQYSGLPTREIVIGA